MVCQFVNLHELLWISQAGLRPREGADWDTGGRILLRAVRASCSAMQRAAAVAAGQRNTRSVCVSCIVGARRANVRASRGESVGPSAAAQRRAGGRRALAGAGELQRPTVASPLVPRARQLRPQAQGPSQLRRYRSYRRGWLVQRAIPAQAGRSFGA